MWRKVGVQANVTAVDFPVFQQRLRTGKFESFIGAWLDVPAIWLYTPTNVAAVATRVGGVAIDPFSWLSGVRGWKVTGNQ